MEAVNIPFEVGGPLLLEAFDCRGQFLLENLGNKRHALTV